MPSDLGTQAENQGSGDQSQKTTDDSAIEDIDWLILSDVGSRFGDKISGKSTQLQVPRTQPAFSSNGKDPVKKADHGTESLDDDIDWLILSDMGNSLPGKQSTDLQTDSQAEEQSNLFEVDKSEIVDNWLDLPDLGSDFAGDLQQNSVEELSLSEDLEILDHSDWSTLPDLNEDISGDLSGDLNEESASLEQVHPTTFEHNNWSDLPDLGEEDLDEELSVFEESESPDLQFYDQADALNEDLDNEDLNEELDENWSDSNIVAFDHVPETATDQWSSNQSSDNADLDTGEDLVNSNWSGIPDNAETPEDNVFFAAATDAMPVSDTHSVDWSESPISSTEDVESEEDAFAAAGLSSTSDIEAYTVDWSDTIEGGIEQEIWSESSHKFEQDQDLLDDFEVSFDDSSETYDRSVYASEEETLETEASAFVPVIDNSVEASETSSTGWEATHYFSTASAFEIEDDAFAVLDLSDDEIFEPGNVTNDVTTIVDPSDEEISDYYSDSFSEESSEVASHSFHNANNDLSADTEDFEEDISSELSDLPDFDLPSAEDFEIDDSDWSDVSNTDSDTEDDELVREIMYAEEIVDEISVDLTESHLGAVQAENFSEPSHIYPGSEVVDRDLNTESTGATDGFDLGTSDEEFDSEFEAISEMIESEVSDWAIPSEPLSEPVSEQAPDSHISSELSNQSFEESPEELSDYSIWATDDNSMSDSELIAAAISDLADPDFSASSEYLSREHAISEISESDFEDYGAESDIDQDWSDMAGDEFTGAFTEEFTDKELGITSDIEITGWDKAVNKVDAAFEEELVNAPYSESLSQLRNSDISSDMDIGSDIGLGIDTEMFETDDSSWSPSPDFDPDFDLDATDEELGQMSTSKSSPSEWSSPPQAKVAVFNQALEDQNPQSETVAENISSFKPLPLPPLPLMPPRRSMPEVQAKDVNLPTFNPGSRDQAPRPQNFIGEGNRTTHSKSLPLPLSLPRIPDQSRNLNDESTTGTKNDGSDWFESFHTEDKNGQMRDYDQEPTDFGVDDLEWSQLLESDGDSSGDMFDVQSQKTALTPITQRFQPVMDTSGRFGHTQGNQQPQQNYSNSKPNLASNPVVVQPLVQAPPPPAPPKRSRNRSQGISLETLWQKYLKLPVILIGIPATLFGLFSIPPVQNFMLGLGLKIQIVKDVSGKNLENIDLQEATLKQVNFSNANLSGANLKKANLNLADFSNTDLTSADLTGASMQGTYLKGTKIGIAPAKNETKLDKADLLMWRILNQPQSVKNTLSGKNLSWFNMQSADLRNANLSGAKLIGADFFKANLGGANLGGADLTVANFTGANLSGANLGGIVFAKNKSPKSDNTTICPNGKKGPCSF